MSRLRTYARLSKQSAKVKAKATEFARVYREVDMRSEGRCEYLHHTGTDLRPGQLVVERCFRRATDHHHTVKPRRSHHDSNTIVHLCRAHHDRCDWPFSRGRLVVEPLGGGCFTWNIQYAKRPGGTLAP